MKRRPGRFEAAALSIWFVSYTTVFVVGFDTPAPADVDFETNKFYVSGTDDSNLLVQSLVESSKGPLQLEELAASGVPSLEEITQDDPHANEELRQGADEQSAAKAEAQQPEVNNLSENFPAGSQAPAALPAPNNARVQSQ